MIKVDFKMRQRAPTGTSSANLLESFGVPSQIVADDLGGIGPGLSFLHGVKVFSMSDPGALLVSVHRN